jgi:hypothetical protein
MITRTLARRLERLEADLVPLDHGVTEHTIVFVDADGTETESMVLSQGTPYGRWPARRSPVAPRNAYR